MLRSLTSGSDVLVHESHIERCGCSHLSQEQPRASPSFPRSSTSLNPSVPSALKQLGSFVVSAVGAHPLEMVHT